MNELPERHRPVPRHLPPVDDDGQSNPVVSFLDRGVKRVARAADAVIDRAMLPLLIVIVAALCVVLGIALGGGFEDRGPGCVTEHTDAGQAVCVKR